ncbi:DinB family protein [Wenxinia marina]|uniref:Damage-inducible protein DinB n=1 Tax=Wenxinia marina DSM 24838 TaxID=1123501 RepID=A0A0D0QEX6_9RHOB|nr:DinB family protein [Wenxinia marina]KIQ69543.1 hypothetical protein Wenmar_01906 [Wenxinia marina DSM 24838]GGL59211.1 hypothetical protein GCM10011392_12120 [Wenxinia marina]
MGPATPDYVRLMARYNAWQNDGLSRVVTAMPPAELTEERGAFWGSILGTLNHLLWGDAMWLSRFAGTPAPSVGMKEAPTMTPTAAEWAARRKGLDQTILTWADGLRDLDLAGDLTWYSGLRKAEVTRPLGPLVVHFFNHQTHHRGQVHHMLTAAGHSLPDTDLFLMPDGG